jgi:hypothetical protein
VPRRVISVQLREPENETLKEGVKGRRNWESKMKPMRGKRAGEGSGKIIKTAIIHRKGNR